MPTPISPDELLMAYGHNFQAEVPKPAGMGARALSSVQQIGAAGIGIGEAIGLPLGDARRRMQIKAEDKLLHYYDDNADEPQRWADTRGIAEKAKFGLGQAVDMAPGFALMYGASLAGGPPGAVAAATTMALGRQLQYQRQAAGRTDILATLPVAVASGGLHSFLGVGGAITSRTLGTGIGALDAAGMPWLNSLSGVTGGLARMGAAGVKGALAQTVESGIDAQLDNVARLIVDKSTSFTSPEAIERTKQLMIAGAFTGGLFGAGMKGWKRRPIPGEQFAARPIMDQPEDIQPAQGQQPVPPRPAGPAAATGDEFVPSRLRGTANAAPDLDAQLQALQTQTAQALRVKPVEGMDKAWEVLGKRVYGEEPMTRLLTETGGAMQRLSDVDRAIISGLVETNAVSLDKAQGVPTAKMIANVFSRKINALQLGDVDTVEHAGAILNDQIQALVLAGKNEADPQISQMGQLYEALMRRAPPSLMRAPDTVPPAVPNLARGPAPAAPAPVQPEAPATPTESAAAPAPLTGPNMQRVFTATGDLIDTQMRVVEADDLKFASGTLQPRDRTRATSDQQIDTIAKKLVPQRLGPSAESDRGAPIVGPDMTIESGNARVRAIKMAQTAYPDRFQSYRSYIEELGFDTAGMNTPVLVRQRITSMDTAQRVKFAQDSNFPSTMDLTAVEKAKIDSSVFTDDVLTAWRGGDIDSAGNRDFVRAFIGRLPVEQKNAMLDADGNVAPDGIVRIRRALLAAAYDDTKLLSALMESADDNIRSIGAALYDTAAPWLQMRRMAADNTIDPALDITGQLVTAARTVSQLRRQRLSVGDWMQQTDFETPHDPVVDAMVRAFYNDNLTRPVGRDQVGTVLKNYVDYAKQQETPELLGGKPPTPLELARGAVEQRNENIEPASNAPLFAAARPSSPEQLQPDGASDVGPGLPRRRLGAPEPAVSSAGQSPARPGAATEPVGLEPPELSAADQIFRARFPDTEAGQRQAEIAKAYLTAMTLAPHGSKAAISAAIAHQYGITPTTVREYGNTSKLVAAAVGRLGMTEADARAALEVRNTTKAAPGAPAAPVVGLKRDDGITEYPYIPPAKSAFAPDDTSKADALKAAGITTDQDTGTTGFGGTDDSTYWKTGDTKADAMSDAYHAALDKQTALGNLLAKYQSQGQTELATATQAALDQATAKTQRAQAAYAAFIQKQPPSADTSQIPDVATHEAAAAAWDRVARTNNALPRFEALSPSDQETFFEFGPSNWTRADVVKFAQDIDAQFVGAKRMGGNRAEQNTTAYRGGHTAPEPSYSAPLSNLKGTYPDDFYGPNGFKYYAEGDGEGAASVYSKVVALQGRDRAPVTVYRAVPYDKTIPEQIAEIEQQMAAYMKRGTVPAGAALKGSAWYENASRMKERLASAEQTQQPETLTINPGDWVTPSRAYAREHGMAALNGKFKIISKTARAGELFTDGNSILEWGYYPQGKAPATQPGVTATANFKKWFAGSQVVDDQGQPQVLYHGTTVRPMQDGSAVMGDIEAFDRMFTTRFRKPSIDTVGSWFSTRPDESGAGMYGDTIYPVYLNIKNPLETTFDLMLRRARILANGTDDGRMVGKVEVEAYRTWLKKMGKDGIKIVHDEGAPSGSTEFKNQDAWIALEPEQIKSATGNIGTFDPNNANIVRQGSAPNALVDAQLRNYLARGPNEVQTGPAGEAAQSAGADAVQELQATTNPLARSMAKEYAANQRISLVGQKVRSASDLAMLAQVYSDPRFETARTIFVDDKGQVVAQLGLTSRLPASSQVIVGPDVAAYLTKMSQAAAKEGATGFYMVHNHPSGETTPSRADLDITRLYRDNLGGLKFLGHAVLDHDKFSLVNNKMQEQTYPVTEGSADLFADPNFGKGTALITPTAVKNLADTIKPKEGVVTLIATDSQLRVRGISTIPEDVINNYSKATRRQLQRAALVNQGAYLFAVGRNEHTLSLLTGDVVDAVYVTGSGRSISLSEQGRLGVTNTLFPANRRARVSPDSSTAFNYLRAEAGDPINQPPPRGARFFEEGTPYDATGEPEQKKPPTAMPQRPTQGEVLKAIAATDQPSPERIRATIDQLPEPLRAPVTNITETLADYGRRGLDKVVFLHDLMKRAAKNGLTKALEFERTTMERGVYARSLQAKASQIAEMYVNVPEAERGNGPNSVNKFLYDSTIERKWGWGFKADPEMEARFNALSPESQAFAQAIIEHGASTLALKKQTVLDRTRSVFDTQIAQAKAAGDEAQVSSLQDSKAQTITKFQRLISMQEGWPYAPLRRTGEYVVTAKSPAYLEAQQNNDAALLRELETNPAEHQTTFVPNRLKAAALAAELRKTGNFPGEEGVQFFPREETRDLMFGGAAMLQALDKLRKNVEAGKVAGEDTSAELTRQVNDMYLQALTESSARKSEMRRRSVPGDVDMLQAFARQARADANFLAGVEYGPAEQEALLGLRQQAITGGNKERKMELYNEILKRYQKSLEFNTASGINKLTRMSSLWYLATSPRYFFINATQPWVLGVPELTRQFDYGDASSELWNAYKDLRGVIGSTKLFDQRIDFSKLPEDVRAAMLVLRDRGRLDFGMETELGSFQVDSPNPAAQTWNKIDKGLRLAVQKVETVNHLSTGMAAYRLMFAKTGNAQKAIDYADEVVYGTQGDYSKLNAPIPFNTNLGRVALQFRKMQLIQGSFYAKLINDAYVGNDRAGALRALAFNLGHTAVLAGMEGLPGYAALTWGLGQVMGKDDEPYSVTQKMRQTLGGGDVANLIMRGAPALAGADISGSVGVGNLFSILPFSTADLTSRRGVTETMGSLLGGAAGSMVARMADGMGLMASGDYYRGLEATLPKGLSDAVKSYRIATEGVTRRNGDVLMTPEDVTEVESVLQALGFNPVRQTVRSQQQNLILDANTRFQDKARTIKMDYIRAVKAGKSTAEARAAWDRLQESRVRAGYKRQPLSSLLKAPADQLKREKRVSEGGVQYTNANREAVEELE